MGSRAGDPNRQHPGNSPVKGEPVCFWTGASWELLQVRYLVSRHLSARPGLCPEALGPQSRLVPHPRTCPLASLCFSAPLTPLSQIFCAARWDWENTIAKLLITSSPFTVMTAPMPDFLLKTLVPHQPQAACFHQHTCLYPVGSGDPCSVVIASTPSSAPSQHQDLETPHEAIPAPTSAWCCHHPPSDLPAMSLGD